MLKLKSKSEQKQKQKHSARGFTLIAALLIMVLLSGLAIGLLFMVSNEVRAGGNGLEDNLAYYDAESGMEKLTSDLSALYQTSASPSSIQIQNLINFPPTTAQVGTATIIDSIVYALDANGNPVTSSNTISSGSNQGLYAEIIPMTLQVNATRPSGASVNMTRSIEVALIPVFQFGVFCGYDCSYFAGPNFSFGGRVHTNGNLFLASGAELVFNDKVSAFGQIITDELENGHLTSAGYGGTVYVPKTSGACALNTFPPPGANCIALPNAIPGDASWSGGVPPLGGANPGFTAVAAGFNGFFINGATGASNLQLPFVQNSCTSNPPPCTDPIQIIRKPLAGELATSTIGQSREYNKAEIRILIADTQVDLHPERGAIGDGQDVQLTPNGFQNVAVAFNNAGGAAGGNEYYAMANTGVDANWTAPLNPATGTAYGWTTWPLLGEITTNPPTAPTNPGGVGAWIRVEYLNNANPGAWVGITTSWLQYGFGRAYNTVPVAPVGSAGANTINPDAILILQQLSPTATTPTGGATPQSNWYPINLYDPREGEMRDNANGCNVNGIMNAVEIDVGNLALWLKQAAPYGAGAGHSVNITNQNGYVLYFSDHRGMLPDPNPSNAGATPAGVISGAAGLEDVVNSAQPVTSNTPDGVQEPATYYNYSPEDVDQNGFLDNWGAANIGNAFGQNTKVPLNPYVPINNPPHPTFACNTTGLANAVTGARHVLKLVDAGMNAGTSYLPVRWDNGLGGFTVVSENPVYVQGNYNSGPSDPFWGSNGVSTNTPHSAAAIIADAVSVLSNNWTDLNSLNNPTTLGNRGAAQSYYRMAVAGGKNIPFPIPAWETAAGEDFGTDGGLHNFLRLLEAWGGQTLNYDGSLVSMYYAEYNTGTFKCCTVVYGAPPRNFWFDTLFLNPANLPPGTPSFQDVVNLSYHENYTPQ
jgi:Tfp pilus assembly protein PilX